MGEPTYPEDSILSQLSSQAGDRTEGSNKRVAGLCEADPSLLDEIAHGLQSPDPALIGDCAEVFTMVAEKRPDLVARYASQVAALIGHKNTRVRWEAMHTLAFIASQAPGLMAGLLPQLQKILHNDKSIIVRDYCVDAIGNYAGSGREEALATYPLLKEGLEAWDNRHAGHALSGLAKAITAAPELREETQAMAQPYLAHPKGVVRKAAKALMKI
jgi:hypothetical protein